MKNLHPQTKLIGFLAAPCLVLAYFALSPAARAECRDGCDGQNTFQGEDALLSVTFGFGDTAVGYHALLNNTSGSLNTAVGGEALSSNTTGGDNTALGFKALLNNTTGSSNTATGSQTLVFNTTGSWNIATGLFSLFNNTTGYQNTATGTASLLSNTTGSFNTATGYFALGSNETGEFNTATGEGALFRNTTGNFNTANGLAALNTNQSGSANTAIGTRALLHNKGDHNIALGFEAGWNLNDGDNNIDIGHAGVAHDKNTIRIGEAGNQTNTFIAGISGVTVAGGVGVIIDPNGQLGTVVSSERFKEAIKPMDDASEAILALKPVTFRYKKDLDPEGIKQFGLVAEQVEKVNPDLVARDRQGRPYSVRYEAVNAMLLNEFLKEHRKVGEQQAMIAEVRSTAAKQATTIAQQQKEIETLTAALKEQAAQIQKVSARLEADKITPRAVASTH